MPRRVSGNEPVEAEGERAQRRRGLVVHRLRGGRRHRHAAVPRSARGRHHRLVHGVARQGPAAARPAVPGGPGRQGIPAVGRCPHATTARAAPPGGTGRARLRRMRPRGSRAAARPSTWAGAWMLTPARAPTIRQAASSWLACAAEATTMGEASSASLSVNSRAFREPARRPHASASVALAAAARSRARSTWSASASATSRSVSRNTSPASRVQSAPQRVLAGQGLGGQHHQAARCRRRQPGAARDRGEARPPAAAARAARPAARRPPAVAPRPSFAGAAIRTAAASASSSRAPGSISMRSLGRRSPGDPAQQHLDPLVQHASGTDRRCRRRAAAPADRRASRTPAGVPLVATPTSVRGNRGRDPAQPQQQPARPSPGPDAAAVRSARPAGGPC